MATAEQPKERSKREERMKEHKGGRDEGAKGRRGGRMKGHNGGKAEGAQRREG